jgi:hypothetical protein
MANALHSKQTVADGIHVAHSLEFADATARGAYTATTADVGRIARQLDTGAFWVLNDDSPLTWTLVSGISSAPSVLMWGNDNIATSTTLRYLTPGYTDDLAETIPTEMSIPTAGTIRKMRIRHTAAGTGASSITYTLQVNGSDSSLLVTMLPTAQNGSDLVHTVTVAAGDIIRIKVTKAGSITTSPSNLTCSVELVGA